MRPHSTLSDSDSDSTMSSAFSDDGVNNSSSSQQFFAKLVRDTRSKVEQKTSVINANLQEKLPEWKQRGAMYSTKAKETSIEWSRRGKEAVDRWKKDRADEETPYPAYRQPGSQDSENAVFGMPLEVAVALTKIDADDLIPAVFRRCIEYLNDAGVHEVGIYRVSGSTTTVNKLRAIFNDGSDIDFDITRPDPHAVGTLLKMYLRELPEPIIPFEVANEYTQQFMKSIQQQTSNEMDKKAMRETIEVSTSLTTVDPSQLPPISPSLLKTVRSITSRLPIYNFCLLQLLCRHLKRVADNEEENRMSISNLAVIFIPTLNMGRALFHCMVEHYSEIFEGNHHQPYPAGPVNKAAASATTIVPPPLPQKPRNLIIDSKPKRIVHAKTLSDTGILMVTASPTSIKVPPPKPHRSPIVSQQPQQQPQQQQVGSQPLINNRPRVPIKPRSKSFSYKSNLNQDDFILRKTSGRVEAIGRQFETLMNNKK